MIVATDLVAQENDAHQLVPMLEQVATTFGRTADETVVDSGYDTNTQLAQVEAMDVPVLVAQQPDSNSSSFAKASFVYDATHDLYRCPQGRSLPLMYACSAGSHRDYARQRYQCDPKGCPVRTSCTSSAGGRSIYRTEHDDVRARMTARLATPANRILMSLRKEIVEHVFGQIKSNQGFRRFLSRGEKNAKAQWVLASLAHNVWKLHAAWKEGRYEVKKAS
ncbi:MAG: hypothetical protein EOO70_02705 [Myxococcaceae bacterium]|nr:MAG: hypothetical protein EOO70_02705 [Myxococcaceae bacterium]